MINSFLFLFLKFLEMAAWIPFKLLCCPSENGEIRQSGSKSKL